MICTPQLHFADLNILHVADQQQRTVNVVQKAIDLGYDCVAINVDIGKLSTDLFDQDQTASTSAEPPIKKKKSGKVSMKHIPSPYLVDEKKLNLRSLVAQGKRFRQYSRITATVDRPDYLHAFFRDKTVQRYDLVALRPETEACLSTLAVKGDTVDLLCFEIGAEVPWLYRGKLLNRAIDTVGVTVELCYAPALSDNNVRCQWLANGRQLLAQTRNTKGVILCSGASRPIELRAPLDAANLTTLMDCHKNVTRRLVSDNCNRVLLRAEGRRTIRGAIAVRPIDQIDDNTRTLLDTVAEFGDQMKTA